MIAAWKVKRELQRLGQQVSAIHQALWEPMLQRSHDRLVRTGLPMFDGAVAQMPKIALYLIYQPGVLPESIVQTCQFLTDHGFSPLVVANGGLSAENREQLLPHVWRILERPNVGYDFGGYRDGILNLQMWESAPEKLLILNDSIWFPIFPGDTLLDRMEAAKADVAGTVLRKKNHRGFLESYLYLIDGRVLKNPAIQDFWRNYRLTANKYKVIRRGERGHSAALLDAGFELHPMFSADKFMSCLRDEDNLFLEKTIRFGSAETAGLSAEHDAILRAAKDDGWRDAALNHIGQVLQSGQFYSAFPYASVRLMNYPILKRSGDMVSVLWRRAYLAAVEAGELETPLPAFYTELRSKMNSEAAL